MIYFVVDEQDSVLSCPDEIFQSRKHKIFLIENVENSGVNIFGESKSAANNVNTANMYL